MSKVNNDHYKGHDLSTDINESNFDVDIPILTSIVEDTRQVQSRKVEKRLPIDTEPKTPLTPATDDANPFLPPHIRKRGENREEFLNAMQGGLLDLINNKSRLNSKTSTLNTPVVDNSYNDIKGDLSQELIDALIIKYMPIIEADLRDKLKVLTLK